MTQTAIQTQEGDQIKQFEEGTCPKAVVVKEIINPDIPSTSKQGIFIPKQKKEAKPSAPAEMVKLIKHIYEQRGKLNNVD